MLFVVYNDFWRATMFLYISRLTANVLSVMMHCMLFSVDWCREFDIIFFELCELYFLCTSFWSVWLLWTSYSDQNSSAHWFFIFSWYLFHVTYTRV